MEARDWPWGLRAGLKIQIKGQNRPPPAPPRGRKYLEKYAMVGLVTCQSLQETNCLNSQTHKEKRKKGDEFGPFQTPTT